MPRATTRPRRSQTERVAESTERLLRAAVELIAEQGYEKTTAGAIGHRAGYSRSMVRVRYGSKEELLETILRREFEPRMLRPPPEGTSGLEQVLGQLQLVRDLTADEPDLARAFWVLSIESIGPIASLRPWMTDWLDRYEMATATALRAGIADGSVREAVDPDAEARQIVMFGLGLAFKWLLGPDSFDVDGELGAWQDRLEHQLAG